MTFEVIPAIDVAGGRLARLNGAGHATVDAFGGDPRAAAERYASEGARWIHVVDLDLAGTGEPGNLDVVRTIAELGPRVQASGGVTTVAQVDALLAAGAARAVVGSAALADRDATERLLAGLGEALAVGIEADGPRIVPRGSGGRELPLWETIEWLRGLGVPRFVFTEVGRVGSLEGPDLDGIRALATITGRPVIASGGIRGLEDLRAIAGVGGSVEGAIVGRALLEGDMDLRSAMAAFA